MDEVKSVRFGYVSKILRRQLGTKETEKLLRDVGWRPTAKAGATVYQEAALVRGACLAADDPTLSAQVGLAYRDARTLSAYIGANSETLRHAIVQAARFFQLADPTTVFELERSVDGAVLAVHSTFADLQSNARYQEFLVFGVLARIQTMARSKVRPKEVAFRHKGTGGARAYERLVGCPVLFGAAFSGLKLSNATLDSPLTGFDPDLVTHLTALAEAQLSNQGAQDQSMVARVERMLVEALPARFLGADEVAASLGMTRRTLTRRLSAEGTSFRALCNGLRFRLAKAYLLEGRSITETAFLLGYGEQATFSSAFRVWSGESPSEFRGKAQSGGTFGPLFYS